jgi:hypothetical protein
MLCCAVHAASVFKGKAIPREGRGLQGFSQRLRDAAMRPEIQTTVQEIEQAIGLLRRHL